GRRRGAAQDRPPPDRRRCGIIPGVSAPAPDPAVAALAREAARAAGALLRGRFGSHPTGVGTKSTRTDLVSDADRDAEALIVGMIRTARPGDTIVSEEGSGVEGGEVRWIVDPLDGTTNFLWGIPHWSVSVAVEDAAGPAVGVVFDACRDELFCAVRGAGA